MDKDVKRALLLWPTLASTALVAATTLPMCWDSQFYSTSLRSLTTSSTTVARIVSTVHGFLGSVPDVDESSMQVASVDTEELANSSMFRSLRDVSPMHRPDRGMRGLATPTRFAGGSLEASEIGIVSRDGRDEGGRSSEAADLGSSSQVIARTLLAPVLDPVAELAGYSGQEPIASASLDLPSILAPGMDDPFTATGNPSQQVIADRDNVGDWMRRLNRGATLAMAASAEQPKIAVVHCIGSPTPQPIEYVPKVKSPNARGDAQQEPSDASSPATNRAKLSSAIARSPVTWPQPVQLYEDLAVISTDADLVLSQRRSESDSMLTSLSSPSSNNAGSLQRRTNAQIIAELFDRADQLEKNRPDHHRVTAPERERQSTTLAMGQWAADVERSLDELRSLPRIGDERSGEQIRELKELSETGLQLAERVPARDQQVRWLRASHALSRRAAVWGPIWQLARMSGDEQESPASQVATSVPGVEQSGDSVGYSLARFQPNTPEPNRVSQPQQVAVLVAAVRQQLSTTGDESGWSAFLLLDEIEAVAASNDADERALLAQRFLSRLDHFSLKSEHRKWLQQHAIRQLAVSLQSWTAQPIDYARLLGDLERGETDSIDLAAIKVSEAFQTLRFSESVEAARVAKAIDVTYRNANVRTAISSEMLNRFLPTVPTRTEPIQATILGNSVRGVSTVRSDLNLQLIPSPHAWQLSLGTFGDVQTQSRGGQSGVTVLSSGHNNFNARTPVTIRPNGYQIGQTEVSVTGDQRLRGIRSSYDGWPLIGSLVHGIAESRFEDALPVAERISNERIRGEVTAELQTQLTQKTRGAETQLSDLVLGPLGRLNLDPKVIDLETTPQRLVARYRLAGDWQLASHTPRPRAWSDSLVSVQIHQSALNNTLERLLPTGHAKSIQQFYADTVELFGQDAKPLPDDVPGDAMIEFASTRPITVEMVDGKVWITLRVVRLAEPEGSALTRFIVRAGYAPKVNGLDAHLVRDGHLSISGPGMTMGQRIAVRALFNKILSEQRPIPLTGPRIIRHPAMQGLAISQLELRDGWLALAISPESSPRVAAIEASQVSR